MPVWAAGCRSRGGVVGPKRASGRFQILTRSSVAFQTVIQHSTNGQSVRLGNEASKHILGCKGARYFNGLEIFFSGLSTSGPYRKSPQILNPLRRSSHSLSTFIFTSSKITPKKRQKKWTNSPKPPTPSTCPMAPPLPPPAPQHRTSPPSSPPCRPAAPSTRA